MQGVLAVEVCLCLIEHFICMLMAVNVCKQLINKHIDKPLHFHIPCPSLSQLKISFVNLSSLIFTRLKFLRSLILKNHDDKL